MLDAVVEAAERMLMPHVKVLKNPAVGLDKLMRRALCALGLVSDKDVMEKTAVVGVHGMGGVGKTTLAWAIYNAAATSFSGRRIFFTVGQHCGSQKELSNKRCKLLSLLSSSNTELSFPNDHEERESLRDVLRSGPPKLLVLDDIWTSDQLHWLLACEDTERLQPEVNQLFPGSRVLLISRSRRIVSLDGPNASSFHLARLDNSSSEQLLCQAAFGTTSSPPQFTSYHRKRALKSCGGLPLALEVLGRHLRRAEDQWQVQLHAKDQPSVVIVTPECSQQCRLCMTFQSLWWT